MRAVRRRKKKLIVAFHFFLFGNQAGWKCDECRRAGLETRRGCAWFPGGTERPGRIVWARKRVSTEACPKSFISPQSVAWLERFLVWRKLGRAWTEDFDARETEAFLILEAEWAAEGRND